MAKSSGRSVGRASASPPAPVLSVRERAEQAFGELLATRRWCYVIPRDAEVEGHGFRVSIAIEFEEGHRPIGSLAVLSDDRAVVRAAYADGAAAPWFWGKTYEEAQEVCKLMNERIGVSEKDAAMIIATTMGGARHAG